MTRPLALTQSAALLVAALAVAAPLSSATAQGYGRPDASVPSGFSVPVEAPVQQSRSFFGMPAWVLETQSVEPVATGSTQVDRTHRDGRRR